MITLSNFQERMSEDMRLRDFRERTQEAYLLAVRQFLDKVKREPEAVTDEDVRAYFLFLREERRMAPSTINVVVHGLRFFFIHTLHRDWPVFDLLRVNNPRKLPVVLGRDEVRAVLSAIRYPVRRMALMTIYALGLRLNEGLHLQSGHIDGGRLLVWVRDGKGGKDRAVLTAAAFAGAPPSLLEARATTDPVDVSLRFARGSAHSRNNSPEDVFRRTQGRQVRKTSVDSYSTTQLRHALA